MRRFVRLFQPRFAAAVEEGRKLQTIRPTPKRMPEEGDTISLRCWTGKPYRSKQRVLRESKIVRIAPVEVGHGGILVPPPDGSLLATVGCPMMALRDEDADRFARLDGFSDFGEMLAWFDDQHGLPFSGILICWE